ncbi:MAG: efflux RND transporter periplasmic adaptor subunit [Gammaproteobacteria bacterium]|nr:efflux RND transporter periplasmic adaptor subunit [Gammaproteobacteria bacterium]
MSGDVIAITSREPASVLAVHADNTQSVQRGQLLVELDPARAQVAMRRRKPIWREPYAACGRSLPGSTNLMRRSPQRASARAGTGRLPTQTGVGRRRRGFRRRDPSRARRRDDQAAWRASGSELQQARAAVEGTSVNDNPEVLAAIARVHDAAITLSHMQLVAPVDGVVAQRNVQIGQHVAPGHTVDGRGTAGAVWVDANFKEGQLEDVRVGQPATITADIYGAKVSYHGRVWWIGCRNRRGVALLPPQNASGNWIKIVQRVPVRVALDAAQLREHPLRVGLSVSVIIDISDTSGPLMSEASLAADTRAETGDANLQADRIVARILAQNNADALVP